ncbi:hypothetical protein [Micromonospora sp. CA-246542]
MSSKTTSDMPKDNGSSVLPPYDWQSKPITRDTDAACEQVLRDSGRGRR